MSLVIVIRLDNDDLLFVSDKRIATTDGHGFVSYATDQAVKLVPALGGVVGFTGASDLALYFIKGVEASRTGNLTENEIASRLASLHSERVLPMVKIYGPDRTKEILSNEDVNLVWGFRDGEKCKLVVFHKAMMFVHQTKYDNAIKFLADTFMYDNVVILGMDNHAKMLRQWFTKPSYTLLEAQRLALLMLAVTTDAEPTAVNNKIDMLLLGASGKPEEVKYDEVKAWVSDFMANAKKSFFD